MIIKYKVAIDKGIKYPKKKFSDIIKKVLTNKNGWKKYLVVDFKESKASSNLVIRLSTNDTIIRECKFNGLSCYRGSSQPEIFINLDNWLHSTDPFLSTGLKLKDYRTYLILHEVGHFLGYSHLSKDDYPGVTAPIMIQQSKGIHEKGIPNVWVTIFDIIKSKKFKNEGFPKLKKMYQDIYYLVNG